MPIYTKVADPDGANPDDGKWVEIGAESGGELPGLGGWATVQSITGSAGTRYTYNDGVMDWVAYEFKDNSTFTCTDGLLDCLLVGPGGHAGTGVYSCAGSVIGGNVPFPAATITVELGSSGTSSTGSYGAGLFNGAVVSANALYGAVSGGGGGTAAASGSGRWMEPTVEWFKTGTPTTSSIRNGTPFISQ